MRAKNASMTAFVDATCSTGLSWGWNCRSASLRAFTGITGFGIEEKLASSTGSAGVPGFTAGVAVLGVSVGATVPAASVDGATLGAEALTLSTGVPVAA